MQDGIVKFYHMAKGFGFIQPTNGASDVFIYATALERAGLGPLAEGEKVSFDTEIDKRTGKTCVGNIQMA
jgi:CspA family cold shock protein